MSFNPMSFNFLMGSKAPAWRKIIGLWLLGTAACAALASDPAEGIAFDRTRSWEEILTTARTERKPIFVDCFTTWCGPCKRMASEVFGNRDVGAYMQPHYYSVAMQLDRAKGDSPAVVGRYADAEAFAKRYDITAYPTLLFFSPDGVLTNKVIGAISPEKFLDEARAATTFAANLATFRAGALKSENMIGLLQIATRLEDGELTKAIVGKYVNHLEGVPTEELLSPENRTFLREHAKDAVQLGAKCVAHILKMAPKDVFVEDNIRLIEVFVRSSDTEAFKFFQRHSQAIDDVMSQNESVRQQVRWFGYGRCYSWWVMDRVIAAEELRPADSTRAKSEPDWNAVKGRIAAKYGEMYAVRLVSELKVQYFKKAKSWESYASAAVILLKECGSRMSAWRMNNLAFDIFRISDDRDELATALEWMVGAAWTEPNPNESCDTYANLLYKLGRVNEAIALEEQASKMKGAEPAVTENLEKMRRGAPTWPAKLVEVDEEGR